MPKPENVQVDCLGIDYIQGESYKTMRVSGNPRWTSPLKLFLKCKFPTGFEYDICIARQIKNHLKDKLSKNSNIRFTENRRNIISNTMPSSCLLVSNPKSQTLDEFEPLYIISESEMDSWCDRIINHKDWR